MKHVLPGEGDSGGTVLVAVGTGVHVWSVVKTTHVCICIGFVQSIIKNNKTVSLFCKDLGLA